MANDGPKKSELVKIAAIWKRTQKDGKTFFSGNLGSASILIFENRDKLKDNANPNLPDYNVYVKTPDLSKQNPKPAGTFKSTALADDDIPF